MLALISNLQQRKKLTILLLKPMIMQRLYGCKWHGIVSSECAYCT